MHNMNPAESQHAPPPASSPSPRLQDVRHHDIIFTGSGSEYFRIWIVNLLLLLFTFGLYYPWAKVRKLRYFYSNTVVAGYPLAFHAEPRRMLRGFLLVSALMLAYSMAGRVSPLAGGVAGLILAAIWPALMRASLQFRLANTSWRGLRFGFNGSLKDAYLVFLMPALVVLAATVLVGMLGAVLLPWLGKAGAMLAGVAMILAISLVGPYTWWRLKRYQHNHYVLGQLQTQFKATFADTYWVFLRTSLISVSGLAVAGLMLLVGLVGSGMHTSGPPGTQGAMAWLAFLAPMLVVSLLLSQWVAGPYFTSRAQNLVWTKTGNRQMRFRSHLRLWSALKVGTVNGLLTVLTLGLYWPFAAIANARLRLHAIEILSRQDPDELVARIKAQQSDASGDLAADLIGIDVGL